MLTALLANPDLRDLYEAFETDSEPDSGKAAFRRAWMMEEEKEAEAKQAADDQHT